jgi:nitric oxide reductase subunit B
MLVDAWRYVRNRKGQLDGKLVFTFAVGMAIVHFIGAGLWGFAHTLPQINYYTHGSQVTVAHGHIAFFGAYVLLNLMFFYYAMPRLKGLPAFDERRGTLAFWWLTLSMSAMTLAFTIAGVLQTYIERVMGMGYMTAQEQMSFWFAILVVLGLMFLSGAVLAAVDLLSLRPAVVKRTAREAA